MISNKAKFSSQQAIAAVRSHLHIPLFANAYALMTNQVLAAAVGFLYWLMAARLYPDAVVGVNSAIISTIIFMATLAELSFKSAMIRFVPRAGRNTPRLIGGALVINLSIAFLISLFLVTVGRYIPLTSSLLENVDLAPGWLILATTTWSIFYIQDGILIGMRQSKWVLFKNIFLSISKLVLLVAFFRVFLDYGLVTSWFITVPFLVLLFLYLIFFRFMPKHFEMDTAGTKPITRGELFKSITGDHVGTLLAETSTRLLPLLVLHLLGQSFTAYYYQGWNVASTLYLLATSMTNSFTVEASADMQQLALNSRRILRQMATLLIPAVAALWLATPLILRLFGANYALQSVGLLRWLALATIPYIITTWLLSYARILAKVKTIILVQALQLVITLSVSYLLVPVYGIVSIGVAWLLAHCAISLVALPKLVQIFSTRKTEVENEQISPNQVSRCSDWRFLLPLDKAKKSVCLTDGLLARSVATISEQVITDPDPSVCDCDLAVAVDPTPAALQRAYQYLGPDGICYTEWPAWRKGGVWGIRKRLQEAGFTWSRYYVAAPSPSRPRVWASIGSSKAPFRYIAQRFFPSGGLIHRVGRIVIAHLAPILVRAGLVPQLSVIAGKSGSKADDVFEFIQAEWPTLCPDAPAGQLSYLMQTGGSLISSNVVYLVFVGSELYPYLVVKLPRDPTCAISLQHEQEVLSDLKYFNQGRPSTPLVVPQFIPMRSNRIPLYGQSGMRGKSIGDLLGDGQFETIADWITEALISLAQYSTNRAFPAPPKKLVDQMRDAISDFSDRNLDPSDVARTGAILSMLEKLPPTYVHNDFAVWNMVAVPHGLGVFDWSDADRNGLPLLDLVYSLSGAAFLMDDAHSAQQRESSYLRLLDPDTPAGSIFQNCLQRYTKETGLDPALIPSLRLATWVVHSLYERIEYRREFGPHTQPDESVCTPLWKAELRLQQPRPASQPIEQKG